MSELDRVIVPDKKTMTYASYLKVKELLALQQLQSEPAEHDEMLFIIIHQVYEIWFKQILHELDSAEAALTEQKLMPFLKGLNRIICIQKVLNHQVDILETMTPNEFNRFRELLNPASGFQSYQFRLLEFRLGAKQKSYLKFFEHDPQVFQSLQQTLSEPSLLDRFIEFLHAKDFAISEATLTRDRTQMHPAAADVVASLETIYRNPEQHYELYLACEALVDVDENLLQWRYRHVAMVERMIGSMRGTGGSSGVNYLARTLQTKLFPELWQVRNHLG